MADDERTEETPEQPEESPEQPEESPAEEPAGKEGEDQPEEVQGEETVVEDTDDESAEASEPEPSEEVEAPAGAGEGEPATEDSEDSEKIVGAELDPIAIEPERELSAEERARLEAEAEERARLEAEATAEAGEEEPVVQRRAAVEIPAEATIQATGKRKSSIARVILRRGEGKFEVNRRPLDEYFPREYLRTLARQPLLTAGYEGDVDVQVRVHGGGISGQAGAVRHGIARALCEIDPELRPELKRRGLLTRDARRKERRKAGLKKARKRPQFSKR
jgi:small subunit ribosomal protein S9